MTENRAYRGLRLAYADPPYPGQARKHYSLENPNAAEVDFAALIDRLVAEFPDGWALSCNSGNLRDLLPLCPDDVRVMAWVKRFAKFKPGVNPLYAWEPVIVRGGRKHARDAVKIRDWVDAVPVMASAKVVGPKVVGQKPVVFVNWLRAVLNVQADDELVDLYPGSGVVGRVLDQGCFGV